MKVRPKFRVAMLLLALSSAACSDGTQGAVHTLGDFSVVLMGDSLQVRRADGTALLSGVGASQGGGALPGPVAWRKSEPDIREAFAM
jgi:hypothetical protein